METLPGEACMCNLRVCAGEDQKIYSGVHHMFSVGPVFKTDIGTSPLLNSL